MRIIAVDNDKGTLDNISRVIKKALPDEKIRCFSVPDEAYEFVSRFGADVAFINTDIEGKTGKNYSQMFMEINPEMNIIYVSGQGFDALASFRISKNDYTFKPIDEDIIKGIFPTLYFPNKDRAE